MGAVFTSVFEDVSVSAAQDFFELAGGGVKSFRVRRICISTKKTSTEILRLTLNRHTGAPTSGSGGSTPNEEPRALGFGSATVSCEANNTTRISGGTKAVLQSTCWNLITPFEFAPLDQQDMPEIAGDDHFTIALEAAPGAAVVMCGTIQWEEIG